MTQPNFTNERLIFAAIIGAGAGFLLARYLFGNYLILMILGAAVAIAVDTTLRASQPIKEIQKQQEQAQKNFINRLKGPGGTRNG